MRKFGKAVAAWFLRQRNDQKHTADHQHDGGRPWWAAIDIGRKQRGYCQDADDKAENQNLIYQHGNTPYFTRESLFWVYPRNQPFIAWGHAQDIGGAFDVKGHTCGHNDLIFDFGKAIAACGTNRRQNSALEAVLRFGDGAMRAPCQRKPAGG